MGVAEFEHHHLAALRAQLERLALLDGSAISGAARGGSNTPALRASAGAAWLCRANRVSSQGEQTFQWNPGLQRDHRLDVLDEALVDIALVGHRRLRVPASIDSCISSSNSARIMRRSP
jgi:hypothetical protein